MRFGGLIAAIVFAAIAAVIVLRMSADQGEPMPTGPVSAAPSVESVNIFVAAAPIPVGTTIKEDMVSVQPWPKHLMLDGFIKAEGNNSVVGMVARAPFQQQEPIIVSKVTNAADSNFLAGALPKGMRVLTIQTNEIEGLAGFVFPGDRVDVLMTHDIKKWVTEPDATGAPGAPRQDTEAVTETLLTNVTVMAVDQRSSSAGSTDEKGNLLIPRSISLMVSPSDAQRLRLGAREGTLTLAMRSVQDRESSDPLILTRMGDISQAEEATPPLSVKRVTVIRGTESDTQKSSGGLAGFFQSMMGNRSAQPAPATGAMH